MLQSFELLPRADVTPTCSKTQNASGIVTEFKLVSGTEDSIDWQ